MYKQYTKERLAYYEEMKDSEEFRFVFDEDLSYLPKAYYGIYQDTVEEPKMQNLVAEDVSFLLDQLRAEFSDKIDFDFHACFYYD